MNDATLGDADSPLQRYQRLLADSDAEGARFFSDVGQQRVVQQLDELFQRLMHEPNQSMWQKLFTKSSLQPVQGLYIWGTVGRGKTLLMDLLFDCLPDGRAQRMHFHRFMRRVHVGLTAHGGVADPLQKVADEFAHEADLVTQRNGGNGVIVELAEFILKAQKSWDFA